jgi:hypothetical protein
MIIRALVKAATFIAFTPVPEYVHWIGRIASVGSLAMACNTHPPMDVVEEENPFTTDIFGNPVEGASQTIMKEVAKDTAADVWFKLLPTDDFSIRDAIKTFKGLDEDQKEIFVLSAIGAACEAFYVVNSFIRLGSLTKQRDLFKERAREAERKNRYAIFCLSEQIDKESGVINWYERNHAMVDWSNEAERANYSNVSGSVAFMKGLIEELGGSAV